MFSLHFRHFAEYPVPRAAWFTATGYPKVASREPLHFGTLEEAAAYARMYPGLLWRRRKVVTRYPTHLLTNTPKRSR